MIFSLTTRFARVLCVGLISCTLAHGECPVKVVVVKGRVDHAGSNAKVRVQLVYGKDQPGDLTTATIENGTFIIPVEFLTQSRRPVLIGALGEKCNRKPKTVVVTLVEGDEDLDRVSLDFDKDLRMTDSSAYGLRSEIVLNGSH